MRGMDTDEPIHAPYGYEAQQIRTTTDTKYTEWGRRNEGEEER